MFSRLPPAQRRLFLLSLGALVLAVAFVLVAIIVATGRPAVVEGEYRPFEVGNADRLSEAIATERPLFFADPTGGTRGFVLTLADGNFAALHVVPPRGRASCPVDWNLEEERFEDCDGRAFRPDQLSRFPVTINDDGVVVVDLREPRRPDAPAPEGTETGASGRER